MGKSKIAAKLDIDAYFKILALGIRLGHLMLFPLHLFMYICLFRELGGVGAGATLVREKGQVSEETQISISSE